MKAELERRGMLLKTSKNLLQIYLFFYGAVLSDKCLHSSSTLHTALRLRPISVSPVHSFDEEKWSESNE